MIIYNSSDLQVIGLFHRNIRNNPNDRIFGINFSHQSGIAHDPNGSRSSKRLSFEFLHHCFLQSHSISIRLQAYHENNTLVLLVSFLYGLWAFILVFSCCELGQQFSNGFQSLEDKFYRIKWYLMPIGIQKLLPIFMLQTQNTFVVKFFGSYMCSREQFKKVWRDQKISKRNYRVLYFYRFTGGQ